MNLNEYQTLALRTAHPRSETINEGHDILHAGLGLATEAGEFLDALKKRHAYNKPIDAVNLIEEVGDVLWYAALACRGLGITLEQAAEINIAKLARRYPDKFTEEAAINRDVVAERRVLEDAISVPAAPYAYSQSEVKAAMPTGVTREAAGMRRIQLGTPGTSLLERLDGWQVVRNGEVIAITGEDRKTLVLANNAVEGPWLIAAQMTIDNIK